MKHIRRFLVGITAGLALAVVMGGSAVPAYAATTRYVNDTKANDPSASFCPTAYSTDIQTAVAASNTGDTVIVCQGTYTLTSPVVKGGVDKLALKTKGEVHIEPASGYGSGPLFAFVNVNKLTIQGFYFDGWQRWAASATYLAAIELVNVKNATITKNYISMIGDNYADPNPEGYGIDVYGSNAYDAKGNFVPYTVKIIKNTIYLPKFRGIQVRGNVRPTITGNRIIMTGEHGIGPWGVEGMYLENLQGAFSSMTCGTKCRPIGGTISKNTITGDYNQVSADFVTGIELYDSSNDKITGNIFDGVGIGILTRDDYAPGVNGIPYDTMDNTISGNKGSAGYGGVWVLGYYTGSSAGTPYVWRNKVTGNKLTSPSSTGFYGVFLEDWVNCCSSFMDYNGKKNVVSGNTMLGYYFPYALSPDVSAPGGGGKSGPPVPGAAPASPEYKPELPLHYNAPMPEMPAGWQVTADPQPDRPPRWEPFR